MYRSALALLDVINDVLEFSRLSAGHLELRPSDFCVEEMVDDLLAGLQPLADKGGLELGALYSASVPRGLRVRCDLHRLRQVLTNLVGNACKFTDRGGSVRVLLRHDGARLCAAVRDTGIGIPADALDSMFEPFTQAAGGTRRGHDGTGLGLAICRNICVAMGGSIAVTSELGQGSEFSVEVEAPLLSPPPGATTTTADGPPPRVLLVSKSETLAQVLAHFPLHVERVEALPSSSSAPEGGATLVVDRDCVDDIDVAGLTAEAVVLVSSADTRSRELLGAARVLIKPPRRAAVLAALRGQDAPGGAGGGGGGGGQPPAARIDVPPDCGLVLLADDNRVNQKVAASMLKQLGVEFALAANGREALELWESRAPSLVFMDCHMPEMDGFEASAEIRARERADGRARRTPVVALTADAFAKDQVRDSGMDSLILKPVRLGDLAAALRRFVGGEPPSPTRSRASSFQGFVAAVTPKMSSLSRFSSPSNSLHGAGSVESTRSPEGSAVRWMGRAAGRMARGAGSGSGSRVGSGGSGSGV